EEARARLAKARAAVEQIRQDREGAEAQAVERLEHASDLGLQNKGFFDRIAGWVGDRIDDARDLHHKMLRAIGDLADRLADVLTIVAIALVVVAAVAAVAVMVVGTGGTGGALALGLAGSAWSASGTALTAAGWATLASVGAKAESKFLYHDPDLAWSQLVKDGAIAGLGVAGGPVKAVRFIKGSRYLQAAAWKMGELAVSGNRVAQFSIKAAQFAGRGAGRYQQLHDKVLGTAEDPTLAGMVHTGWKESQALWDKHKDDPLAIFTDPVRTSPGPREEPDGAGVWFKDFGRAVAQV
ncbi:MAG: hypothetical protein ACRDY7_03475, partial [Acidimicrobiia bacterium]